MISTVNNKPPFLWLSICFCMCDRDAPCGEKVIIFFIAFTNSHYPSKQIAQIYITFLALYQECFAGAWAKTWIKQSEVIQSFNHLPLRWTNTQTHPWTCPKALITSSCQMGADTSSKFCVHILTLLTSQNKSLICLNELDVHGFCAGIYKDGFPYYKKKCHFSFIQIYMVCGFECVYVTLYKVSHWRTVQQGRTHCGQLPIFPACFPHHTADFYRFPLTNFSSSSKTNWDLFPSPAT